MEEGTNLERSSGEHLTHQEIHSHVDGRGQDGRELSTAELTALAGHSLECPQCAQVIWGYKIANRKLESLTIRREAGRDSEHPAAEAWALMACRLLPDNESEKLLDHAAQCSRCTDILRAILPDDGVLTAEEFELIQSIPIAIPAAIARTRMGTGTHSRTFSRGWIPAAAAAIMIIFGYVLWDTLKPQDPDRLLARAYTASRPFSFRLPDDGYSAVSTQKGGPGVFSKSKPLLSAIAIIQRSIEGGPDALTMRRKGHVELLERSVDESIDSLQKAERLTNADPQTPLLLAGAYFMRGELHSQSGGDDYARALDYLRRWKPPHPNDPIAFYNSALIYEKTNPEAALQAWRHYLEIDAKSGFADEARQHVRDIESKKNFVTAP